MKITKDLKDARYNVCVYVNGLSMYTIFCQVHNLDEFGHLKSQDFINYLN